MPMGSTILGAADRPTAAVEDTCLAHGARFASPFLSDRRSLSRPLTPRVRPESPTDHFRLRRKEV